MPHDHLSPSAWGPLEWTAFVACSLVTVWVLWRSVRLTFRPGEEDPGHVKRSILQDDDAGPAPRPGAGGA